MTQTFKKIVTTIGMSDHPIARKIATLLRIPHILSQLQLLIVQKERVPVDLIKRIYKERGFTMWPQEMAFIYSLASRARGFDGDFAEVGVYKGASAKLLCEAKGLKFLHLFDTFSGLPTPSSTDGTLLHKNQYAHELSSTQAYLKPYKNVYIYPGVFSETANVVANRHFSFVHLDVDLYESTLSGLEFFYPRMHKGFILSHDYSTLPGVKKGFDEYFRDKPELVIELPTSQCVVVKQD